MLSGMLFFDVETPNRQNSKICSIGVVRTDQCGHTEYENSFLVDPEQGFDSRNIGIHGITPSQVHGQPTFDRLWAAELRSVFSDCVVVAHNACFDINVLGKTLSCYGIVPPEFLHLCTKSASKRLLPSLGSASLPVVSEHYGVALPHHHNALCDAQACRGVYWGLVSEFGPDKLNPRVFIYTDNLNPTYRASNQSQLLTDLYGITLGISLDGIVGTEEHGALLQWIDRCAAYVDDSVIRSATSLIHEILADGRVDHRERDCSPMPREIGTSGHSSCPYRSLR